MGYRKTESGAETAFEVTAEPIQVDAPGPVAFIKKRLTSIPWLIFLLLLWPIAIPYLLFQTVKTTAMSAAMGRMVKAHLSHPSRVASRFRVTHETIAKDGKTISVRDAHRLVIRNHIAQALANDRNVTLHDMSSASGRAYAEGAALGDRLVSYVKTISYRVDLEAGGNVTTLGGGLNESGAFGLAQDISNITALSFYH